MDTEPLPPWLLIRQHRKSQGLTQRRLAELVGAGHRTVCGWEAGRSRPRADRLARVARVLSIQVELLAQ